MIEWHGDLNTKNAHKNLPTRAQLGLQNRSNNDEKTQKNVTKKCCQHRDCQKLPQPSMSRGGTPARTGRGPQITVQFFFQAAPAAKKQRPNRLNPWKTAILDQFPLYSRILKGPIPVVFPDIKEGGYIKTKKKCIFCV